MVAFVASTVLTAANLNTAFNQVTVNAQVGTTYTLVLTDQGGLVTCDNASAVTVTVPPNSSVAYATGTLIGIAQIGAGQVTIAAGAGVTINSVSSQLKISARYAGAQLFKLSTNSWLLIGNLSA